MKPYLLFSVAMLKNKTALNNLLSIVYYLFVCVCHYCKVHCVGVRTFVILHIKITFDSKKKTQAEIKA